MGYDGIIFNSIPEINEKELLLNGSIEFITPRGSRYKLQIDTEYNGIDLYTVNSYGIEDHLTGYEDLKDFLSQQELTIIVFSNNQIEILEEVII